MIDNLPTPFVMSIENIFDLYGYHIEVSPFFVGTELRWFYFLGKVSDGYIVTGLEHPDIENPDNIPSYSSREEATTEAINYVLTNLI
jgi:hypothetical protein